MPSAKDSGMGVVNSSARPSAKSPIRSPIPVATSGQPAAIYSATFDGHRALLAIESLRVLRVHRTQQSIAKTFP